MEFMGYERSDGTVGIRNHVVVISTGKCANDLTARIADGVEGAVPILNNASCLYMEADKKVHKRCLIGLGVNPNAAAVLIVGTGCDGIPAVQLADGIAKSKRWVDMVTINKEGSFNAVVDKGRTIASTMVQETSLLKRSPFDLSCLQLALKCGGSDPTSAIGCNAVAGYAADKIIDQGGTVVFSETAEVIGAEHIVAKRAINKAVSDKFLSMVARFEKSIKDAGGDIRGSQPTPGNIDGGLSTLEEKSLGAIVKTGSRPLDGVLEWAEKPQGKGLYFMDGPCATNQMFTGLAATGAQLINFGLGGGRPAMIHAVPAAVGVGGLPILPCIKTLSNPTSIGEKDWSDVFAGPVITGESSIVEKGEEFLETIIEVASGKPTKLEMYGSPYREVWDMWARGPIM